jgi:thiamine transport system ATP-binding protein
VLEVHRCTLEVGEPPRRLLDDWSATVVRGEVVALHGPSGSGKSTLLRAVVGLHPLARGSVVVDGTDVTDLPTHLRSVGMVFQDGQLFPHLDVAGNLAFGLRMHARGEVRGSSRTERARRTRRIEEVLDLVGLPGFEQRRVESLSGGEAARVALARSLAPEPRVLLLDEPLTGLDPDLHDRLASDLARVLRATSTTALWVTHDRDEAAMVADRAIELTDRTGTIGA